MDKLRFFGNHALKIGSGLTIKFRNMKTAILSFVRAANADNNEVVELDNLSNIFTIRSISDRSDALAANQVECQYLHLHLKIMERLAVCPKLDSGKGGNLQKVCFWILLTLGLLHGIESIKFGAIEYHGDTALEERIRLSSYINDLLIHVCFIRITFLDKAKVRQVFEDLQTFAGTGFRLVSPKLTPRWIVTNSVVVLILVAHISIQSTFSLSNWSLTSLLEFRSENILLSIMLWTRKRNSSEQLEIEQYAASLPDSAKYALGTFETSLTISGWLTNILIQDIFIIAALNMYLLCCYFKTLFEQHPASDSERQNVWMWYCQLKRLTTSVDDAFGFLFKLIHLANALQCADFLLEAIFGTEFDQYFLINVFCFTKIAISYYLCVKINTMMLKFSSWIYDNSEYITADINEGRHWPISIILDDFDRNPIGMGVRDFYVNESFVARFLGIVASTYFIFAAPTA